MLVDAAEVVDVTLKTTLVANVIANIFISGALNLLWGTVNCLQIISHFPLINVLMPANCQLLFEIVVKIVTFDIVSVDGILETFDQILKPVEFNEEQPDNF